MSKLHTQLTGLRGSADFRAANPDLYPPPLPEPDTGKQTGLERDLQRLCEQELSRRGILWYLHLSPRAREKAGVPDLIFSVPCHSKEVCEWIGAPCPDTWVTPWAIELKTATGRLSEAQKRTLSDMEADGWHTAVVRSYEEFREVVFGETL